MGPNIGENEEVYFNNSCLTGSSEAHNPIGAPSISYMMNEMLIAGKLDKRGLIACLKSQLLTSKA